MYFDVIGKEKEIWILDSTTQVVYEYIESTSTTTTATTTSSSSSSSSNNNKLNSV
jgi:hypothetical protein